mgnify:CR=1 FL=1
MDGPDLSGDDRSINSDIQDATEANLDHDSMDSDREALNLVSTTFFFLIFAFYHLEPRSNYPPLLKEDTTCIKSKITASCNTFLL